MVKITIDLTPFNRDYANFTFSPSSQHVTSSETVEFEISKELTKKGAFFRVYFYEGSPFAEEISSRNLSAKVVVKTGTFHYHTMVAVEGNIYLDADCPTVIVH
jgi:hypothetical protein